MPQFDVYKNPSRKTRDQLPYLVDIQHSLMSDLASRIVIPLGKKSFFGDESMTRLTPIIELDGDSFILLTPQLASIPTRMLKKSIGSISHVRSEIIASLDFAISGI